MSHNLRIARLLFVGLVMMSGCSTSDDEERDARPSDTKGADDAPVETASAPADAADTSVALDAPRVDAPDAGADVDAVPDVDAVADGGPPVDSDAGPWQPDGRPHDLRPRCNGSPEVDNFPSTPAFQNAIAGKWWPCGGDFTKNWEGMPVELTADGKWYLLEPTTGLARRTGPDTSGVYRLRPWPPNMDGTLAAFDADFFSEPTETNNVYAPMTVNKEPRQLQIGDLFYARVTPAP